MNPDYEALMRNAIDLAAQGRFKVCPNPCVGAVLFKDGEIIGKGWHKAYGSSHAEVECIEDAKKKGATVSGATLVVTLEPCNHYGKTPPCTDRIIAEGISHVVYGAKDPSGHTAGGIEKLEEVGVKVCGPVLEEDCLHLIGDFTTWQTTDLPYVILKLASTLDGRIATASGHSKWISGSGSRAKVHDIRKGIAESGGAILIGGGTFRADNPRLSARKEGADYTKQPLACVLTSRLPKADADFHLLKDSPERTIFFASPAAAASTMAEALRQKGCRVFAIGQAVKGGPDFFGLFRTLRNDLGCHYVLCEGGGHLGLSLLEGKYINEFHLHMAPIILGDNNAIPLFSGRHPLELAEAINLHLASANVYDGDAHLVLYPK